jgi:N-ethylmaleimide reductase
MRNLTLFTPLQLGPLTLPNRILMAPLTRMRAAMPGNIPQALNAEYYRQRASAGLIISEATPVSPRGHGYFNTPGIHTEAQAKGWKLVTRAVHEAGGRIFLQLWHVGRQSHPDLQPDGDLPLAPSALPSGGESPVAAGVVLPHPRPRALREEEVHDIVGEFRRGAELAKTAGFDGVEVHGANGYLIEQFLSDGANHRDDCYGGNIPNRSRFLLEVTDAVISVWGAERVGVRLSPSNTFGGVTMEDRHAQFTHAISELGKRPIAYLHLVEPRVAGNTDVSQFDESLLGYHFQPLLHRETRLLSAGGYNRDSGASALRAGHADAIVYGRHFIANPDLPRRFAENAPLNPYDRATFYGGNANGYTNYPFLGGKEIV